MRTLPLVLATQLLLCACAAFHGSVQNRNDDGSNNLPGIEFMRKAVNPWRWNPLQGNTSAFGPAVFDFTYNRGDTCVVDGLKLPDAVCDNFDPDSSVNFNEQAGHASGAKEYQEYVAKTTEFSKSIDFNFLDIVATASNDFQEAGKFAATGSVDIICKKAYVRVSKLTMADVLTSDMIKLARTFVKHVYVLPQEFNATVYVSFLKRYATYMKSVTLGSMITECSYFTSQSKATMLSVVSDTEATAAESSWLGGSDTKSASLNVSMECGVYQEQATGGRRVGVRGPQPAYNSDGATWEQLTRARPVPIGVTLGPIVDLMIEEFLPEIQNISIIRENTIRAYPLYCNITNECYQIPPPANPTNEVKSILPTSGAGNWSVLVPTENSFCYLTNFQAFKFGTCYVTIGGFYVNDTTIYYQLAYAETTGNEAFKCGARCLTGVAGVNLINDGLLGTGAKALQLIPSAEGVCLLQGVEFLATTTDVFCHLFVDGGYWKLEGYGGEDGFICSANCLTGLDTNSAEITEFPLLSGQGTVSQTLMLADEYICAPNHARYILAGAEYCRVVQELVVGLIGTYWVLQKGSMQDAFACGAHCFRRDVFTFL